MGRGELDTGQRLAPGLHSSPHGHREPSEHVSRKKEDLVRAELWSDNVTHVSKALSRCKGTRTTAARKQATEGVSFCWEATAFTVDHRNETERVLHYPTRQPH